MTVFASVAITSFYPFVLDTLNNGQVTHYYKSKTKTDLRMKAPGWVKIIRNVVKRCAVGYTSGWAWCSMCGQLVSYCCGADVTLIVDLCHEFCVINLDGPLFICTKEEQRAAICFLWADGVPGAEMHRRISVQYGNSVMWQRTFYKWIERFKNGRKSIKHEEGARRYTFTQIIQLPVKSSFTFNTLWSCSYIQ
jgi:hypothetical protein